MKSLYHDVLLDHYRYPRNKGLIDTPDFSSGVYNPSCGDSVIFTGIVTDGLLTQVAFDGMGCVLSIAAASMLSQYASSKPIDIVLAMTAEQLFELINMQPGPNRSRCVLLSLEALQKGVKEYIEKK